MRSLFREPRGAEIRPSRVFPFDEPVLSLPWPALELLLPRDCGPNVGSLFEIDQPVNAVISSVSLDDAVPVLPDSKPEVVRDADVEAAQAIGEDIDVVRSHVGTIDQYRAGSSVVRLRTLSDPDTRSLRSFLRDDSRAHSRRKLLRDDTRSHTAPAPQSARHLVETEWDARSVVLTDAPRSCGHERVTPHTGRVAQLT